MNTLILNLLLFYFSVKIIFAKNIENKWYKTANNKLYYIDDKYQYTWYDAFLECSLKQLALLTLETQEEHEDIAKILKENFFFHGPNLWVGAVGVNKQFAWIVNSQPVFTNNWLEQHNPDNWNNEENCIHFWENTTQLNDRKCDYKYGFICEENPHAYETKPKYSNFIFNIANHSTN